MIQWLRKILGPDHPARMAWHHFKGVLAALRYGFPARKLMCIGVTGTDGKTTTTHLIEHLLRSVGLKTAMISTVEYRLLGERTPNLTKKTTLSPFLTQKFLRECVQKGAEFAVIECSSHALHQSRLLGIPFSIGVLTNVTHEHLDYHGSMQAYRDSKMILFRKAKIHVLNRADRYFGDFADLPAEQKIIYSLAGGDVYARGITLLAEGASFDLCTAEGSVPVRWGMSGAYNVENALAAAGAALALGISLEQIAVALQSFPGVPGRMQRLRHPSGSFEVIVDFALTPAALHKLYTTLRQTAPGRIIGIIGSCGDRDREKRPIMGKIVAENADVVIVTDEEPYSEDPQSIMQAVLQGALQSGKLLNDHIFLIKDRLQAIKQAIAWAKPGDTLVVTGMGDFTTRTMNHGEIPWHEPTVVRTLLQELS